MPVLALMLVAAATSPSDPVPPTWFSAYLTSVKSVSYFEPAKLVEQPNRGQVSSVIYAGATTAYRADLLCRLRANGRLRRCVAQRLFPDRLTTVAAITRLTPWFRLSSQDVALARAHDARVLLTVYLDDASRPLDRSCPAGWCPTVPPPPSPPPPRLNDRP